MPAFSCEMCHNSSTNQKL